MLDVSCTISKTTKERLNHDPGLVVSDGSIVTVVKEEAGMTSEGLLTPPPSIPPPPATPHTPDAIPPPPKCASVLLNRIRIHLLPLLLEEHVINRMGDLFLKTVNETNIESALLTIVGSIQEEKETRLSTILQTNRLNLSPGTISNMAKFPKATTVWDPS